MCGEGQRPGEVETLLTLEVKRNQLINGPVGQYTLKLYFVFYELFLKQVLYVLWVKYESVDTLCTVWAL